jgi:hypothetical protein
MDQQDFEGLVKSFAREYYAAPRSTSIPTPRGPVNLSSLKGTSPMVIWLLEDFGRFLVDGERNRGNT